MSNLTLQLTAPDTMELVFTDNGGDGFKIIVNENGHSQFIPTVNNGTITLPEMFKLLRSLHAVRSAEPSELTL